MKGVDRIYQQTFVDTYSKLAFVKLYDRKIPIIAADFLNDRVVPLFDVHEIKLLRVLTDRCNKYCGNLKRHDMSCTWPWRTLTIAVPRPKAHLTFGIVERFHKTLLDEFYHIAFRKKVYRSIDELQADLDDWIEGYNEQRPHQGHWCFGKTPMQTFLDSLSLAREKSIAAYKWYLTPT